MGLFTNKYPYTDFHELNLDFLLSQDKAIKSDLEKETASRIHQDEVLKSEIDSEALTRSQADGVLQTLISDEERNRIAADNILQGNIDAEALARGNADTNLQTQITNNKNDIDYVYDNGFASVNLFNGTNVINANIANENIITANNNTRLVYTECKPNSTYTISKIPGHRFQIAYTTELPDINVNYYGKIVGNTSSELTITVGSDAMYVIAFVYSAAQDPSISAEDMISSVQIEIGSNATPYEPYAKSNVQLTEDVAELIPSADLITSALTISNGTLNSAYSSYYECDGFIYLTIFMENVPLVANTWLTLGTIRDRATKGTIAPFYSTSGNVGELFVSNNTLQARCKTTVTTDVRGQIIFKKQ